MDFKPQSAVTDGHDLRAMYAQALGLTWSVCCCFLLAISPVMNCVMIYCRHRVAFYHSKAELTIAL